MARTHDENPGAYSPIAQALVIASDDLERAARAYRHAIRDVECGETVDLFPLFCELRDAEIAYDRAVSEIA